MSLSHPCQIAFLDVDHVMRLAAGLIAWTPADIAYVEEFFAPEVVPHDVLAGIGAPLRALGAAVSRPGEAIPSEATALCFRRGRVAAQAMGTLPGLRLIQRLGESSAGIDLAVAAKRGIAVSCLPRPTLARVAEHVLALILALRRRLLATDGAVRRGWDGPPPQEGAVAYNWVELADIRPLHGQVLGIVGLGEIGVLLARRARAFGMRILYHDTAPAAPEVEHALDASHVDLLRLLAGSDIVSLHVPGNAANRHLIGREQLALMKADALLINTARGSLIDEDALYDALTQGRLGGAGLDVHATEPRISGDRFLALPQVVLTPHFAAGSRTGVLAEITQMVENIEAALLGRSIPHGRIVP